MSQVDFVGGLPEPAIQPFKDIRNTRPSSAEEKAELALTLGRLAREIPACVRNGSVNVVREWRACQQAGMRIAGSGRASKEALTIAIANLRAYQRRTP